MQAILATRAEAERALARLQNTQSQNNSTTP